MYQTVHHRRGVGGPIAPHRTAAVVQSPSGGLGASLLEATNDWTSTSTIHGVVRIHKSNIVLKVVWLLLLLGSSGYCVYSVVNQVSEYLQYSIVTSTENVLEVPALFPAVDICNLNAFYVSPDEQLLVGTVMTVNNAVFDGIDAKDYTDMASEDIKRSIGLLRLNGTLNEDQVESLGFNLDEMLITCRFQGQKCTFNDFYYYYNYHYGSCYRFNVGRTRLDGISPVVNVPLRMSNEPGWNRGLQLELYVGKSTLQQYTYKSGVRVVVHNHTVQPILEQDGIDVKTGLETNIAVSRTFINKLGWPYSNCQTDLYSAATRANPLYKMIYDTYYVSMYYQKLCVNVCFLNFILTKCGCWDLRILTPPTTATQRGCSSPTDVSCADDWRTKFYAANGPSVDCSATCPAECHSVTYNTRLSVATYPTEWYAGYLDQSLNMKILNNNATLGLVEMQKSLLLLNVYYRDQVYELITEEPNISTETLLALVGGHFALFIGFSILSFLELCEFVIYIFFLIGRHIFKNK